MSGAQRIKSLAKGLQLLIILSNQPRSLSLDELTIQSGLSKSSCFRLLDTLKDLGFVVKDSRTKRYSLGVRNIALGTAAISRISIRDLAWPYMNQLRDKTGETISLGMLVGSEMFFVERIQTKFILASQIRTGARLPALKTGGGKAIVAYLKEPKFRQFLKQVEISGTQKITNRFIKQIQRENKKIIADGYATHIHEKGLAAIGCPVRDNNGDVVAAISLSFAISRHSLESARSKLAPEVKEVCLEISKHLGFVEKYG